ncbi:hypothetical protein COOONC_09355 [Cooperia oncophora]
MLAQGIRPSDNNQLKFQFGQALDGHVCGSPQLVSRHQHAASSLLDVISDRQPKTVASADETSTTFLDLPREVNSVAGCFRTRFLTGSLSLETPTAHEALQCIIDREDRLWQSLCEFHFTPAQIDQRKTPAKTWRQTFFELKKYNGIREVYADLINICCHCKALFWKTLGHPCLRPGSPSVRVTPQQFVDMLIYL